MLRERVGIFGPTSLGSGQYQLQLYFHNASMARFLRAGDTLEDSLGKGYSVASWDNHPNDFISGSILTVEYLDQDVIPEEDSGFDSAMFTPGQLDLRPKLQTPGMIFNIDFLSGQDYSYSMNASWSQGAEAIKAVVGDSIVDSQGIEFTIIFLDEADRFNVKFHVQETHSVGRSPASGPATLFRPTPNRKLYQGGPLSDPPRTTVRNRDNAKLDKIILSELSLGGTIVVDCDPDVSVDDLVAIGSSQLVKALASDEARMPAVAVVVDKPSPSSCTISSSAHLEGLSEDNKSYFVSETQPGKTQLGPTGPGSILQAVGRGVGTGSILINVDPTNFVKRSS